MIRRIYDKIGKGKQTIAWLIVSNVVKALSQWGLLVVLVKYFTNTEVGYYNLGMALAAPVFSLSGMQLKSILVVEPSGKKDNFLTYFLIRHITALLATLGLIVYCIFFREINWILVCVIIYKAVENLIDILYGYMQKEDRMIWMSKSEIFKSCITLILCLIVTILFKEINISQLSLVVVSIIFYLINLTYTLKLLGSDYARITLDDIWSIILKGIPLGISVFLSSYITNYPRLAIEGRMGTEMLAYYGSFTYVAIGIFEVVTPVQTFLRQRLSKHYHNKEIKEFKSKVDRTVLGVILLGVIYYIGFAVFGSFLIRLLFNDSYNQYSTVLYLLIGGQMLSSISGVYSTAVLSFNVYTKQAFISAIVLAVVVLLSGYLINKMGFMGAGIVHIVAAALSMVFYGIIYYRRLNKWEKAN